MRNTVRTCLIGLLFFAFASLAYADATHNFLWRFQAKGVTVFLMGSVHALNKDAYPLNKTIEDAFAKADCLTVEANINDLSGVNVQKIMQNALYSGEDNLEKHVSRKTLALIKEETDRLGLPLAVVERQKPWFLASTLQALELLKSGYDPEYGVDKYFLGKGAGKKKILELESVEQQIDLLSGMNEAEQEQFLVYTLNELKTLTGEAAEIVAAWKTGDVKRLAAVLERDALPDKDFYPLYEKLVLNRNKKMAAVIESYLKAPGTYFVVVGAAHLIGNKGIVKLLKDKGYSLEQL